MCRSGNRKQDYILRLRIKEVKKVITCENFVLLALLVADYQFLNCFVNNLLENFENKMCTVVEFLRGSIGFWTNSLEMDEWSGFSWFKPGM